MKNIVSQNIEKIKPYIPGKPIEEVEREFGVTSPVKLASNENPLGASPKAVAAINRNIKNINRYPDATCFYLKRKLKDKLDVSEESLVIGNGSDEIIVLAIRTFTVPGDEVIIARPTFLIYEIASQIQNVDMKIVPMTGEFRYDLKAMKDAVTPRTKMIFIANPDNPTGTYVTRNELDEFFDGLPEDVMVFLDEAYFEFANFSRKDYPNGLDYLKRPNTIVSRSFSKVYGLAGMRIGYGISDPNIINYMERVRDPFNVNILAQAAAIAALDDKAFLTRSLKYVEAQKKLLYKEFEKMDLKYVPSVTNFVIVDIREDCKKIFNALLRRGVIVRDMKAWGLDTYIRVTIGTRDENKRFIRSLKEVLSNKE